MNLEFLHNPRFWNWLGLAVVVGFVLFLGLRFRSRVSGFIGETIAELKKCSWPWNPAEHGAKRYKELLDSTLAVVISSVLLAGFVTCSDFILVKVVGWVTRLS
jgi:preprotein translocase subunit SecE